ncbi:MAG: GAF domain-containing protein [Polyangia bacterium]
MGPGRGLGADRLQLRCAETWTSTENGAGIDGVTAAAAAGASVAGASNVDRWQGLAARVRATGAPEWTEDLSSGPDPHQCEWAASAGMRSALAVPIGADGDVLAVLEFFSVALRPADFPLLGLFASSASQLGAHLIKQRTHGELSSSQHLASVGTLAAGVAHEVNTPVQFVNDSVQFLRDATTDVLSLLKRLQVVRDLASGVARNEPLRRAIDASLECEASVDLDYPWPSSRRRRWVPASS